MQRSLEIALARLRRLQPREIAEDLLLPARDQRFPVLHRSRILSQRRLEPQRHGMLRAVSILRVEADLHPNTISDLRAGPLAHVAVQIQIKTPLADRHQIHPPRYRGLAVDAHENWNGLSPPRFDA